MKTKVLSSIQRGMLLKIKLVNTTRRSAGAAGLKRDTPLHSKTFRRILTSSQKLKEEILD